MSKVFGFILFAVIIAALVFGWRGCQEIRIIESGFCVEEDRYLSNDEIHDAAIAYLIEYRNTLPDTPSPDPERGHQISLPKYESIADFLALNPTCCLPVVTQNADDYQYKRFEDFEQFGFEYSIRLREIVVAEHDDPNYSTTYRVKACGEVSTASDNNRLYSSWMKLESK